MPVFRAWLRGTCQTLLLINEPITVASKCQQLKLVVNKATSVLNAAALPHSVEVSETSFGGPLKGLVVLILTLISTNNLGSSRRECEIRGW